MRKAARRARDDVRDWTGCTSSTAANSEGLVLEAS